MEENKLSEATKMLHLIELAIYFSIKALLHRLYWSCMPSPLVYKPLLLLTSVESLVLIAFNIILQSQEGEAENTSENTSAASTGD